MRNVTVVSDPQTSGDELPARLGRYEPCCRIAEGGMAAVHLARVADPDGYGGVIALKTIHPHLAAHGEFIDMFLDEARIASTITHPNVCRVNDFGEQDGVYFLAMEYLVGEPLDEVIAALALTADRAQLELLPYHAAAIVMQLCEGLHAAHELRDRDGVWLRVVHRDVSPQNVFIGYDGNVKIVDFGLAKAARRITQTKIGTIKGKLAYVAPEMLKRAPIDRRVDVWAAGVCLWELLTGQRLFKRPTDIETLVAVREAPIPPPSTVAWWVPPALDAIVMQALERNPDHRYPSARHLGRDLGKLLVDQRCFVEREDLAGFMTNLFGEARRQQHIALIEHAIGEPLFDDTTEPAIDDELPSRPVVAVPKLRVAASDLEYRKPRKRGRWKGALALVAAAAIAAAAGFAAYSAVEGELLSFEPPLATQR